MNRWINRVLLVAGGNDPCVAAASSLPAINGKWQCTPQNEVPQEQSWVTYDFKSDGTMTSQEWGQVSGRATNTAGVQSVH